MRLTTVFAMMTLFIGAFGARDLMTDNGVVSGWATSYCPNPHKVPAPSCFLPNACGIKQLPPGYEQSFGGLPDGKLGGHCGDCVKVTGDKGSVIVKIVDSFDAWLIYG